ncbi:hypothetical protein [Allosediminivita pacifica]|uniref:hypothetical protein n=1 Tax=Allosediminivita pacifica TaxID=1267769 RepID=UPI001472FF0B|nr:hypothetical protein [Allosediminivita pacifica]GGB29441.1 hypothetical protein GCM10011324_43740 [Allosediminivita pacifica]
MTEKQREAEQKAFERGQEDWRANRYDNPYPAQSPYHDLWQQGQDKERETEQG